MPEEFLHRLLAARMAARVDRDTLAPGLARLAQTRPVLHEAGGITVLGWEEEEAEEEIEVEGFGLIVVDVLGPEWI